MDGDFTDSEEKAVSEVQDAYRDTVGASRSIQELPEQEHTELIHDTNDICSVNGIPRERRPDIIAEGLRRYMMEKLAQDVDSEVKRYREDLGGFFG